MKNKQKISEELRAFSPLLGALPTVVHRTRSKNHRLKAVNVKYTRPCSVHFVHKTTFKLDRTSLNQSFTDDTLLFILAIQTIWTPLSNDCRIALLK